VKSPCLNTTITITKDKKEKKKQAYLFSTCFLRIIAFEDRECIPGSLSVWWSD